MKHFNFKAVIISAFAVFSAFFTTATAFAENSETHEVSVTTSENEGGNNTSDTSDEESSTPRVSDNPQLRAELQNDELYNYLMQYLNNPENFTTDGSGVLIDESILNPNANSSNTSAYNSHSVSSNGEKMMYTVATRDGSIFYIIIDKSGETENVYFLNAVDAVDLAAVIKSGKNESDTYTPQEKDIISQAEESERFPAEGTTSDTSGSTDSDPTSQSGTQSKTKNSDTSIYIIVGVAAVAIIGVAAYKKIGPGKKKKAPAFDELSDDDDEEEEETYSEDDYEEEQQEEVGNFDDDDS